MTKLEMDGMDILRAKQEDEMNKEMDRTEDLKKELIAEAVDEMCEEFSREHETESWIDEDGAGRRYDVLEVWVSEKGQRRITEITTTLCKALGLV